MRDAQSCAPEAPAKKIAAEKFGQLNIAVEEVENQFATLMMAIEPACRPFAHSVPDSPPAKAGSVLGDSLDKLRDRLMAVASTMKAVYEALED